MATTKEPRSSYWNERLHWHGSQECSLAPLQQQKKISLQRIGYLRSILSPIKTPIVKEYRPTKIITPRHVRCSGNDATRPWRIRWKRDLITISKKGESLQDYTIRVAWDVLKLHIGGPIILTKFIEAMDVFDKTDIKLRDTFREQAFSQFLACFIPR